MLKQNLGSRTRMSLMKKTNFGPPMYAACPIYHLPVISILSDPWRLRRLFRLFVILNMPLVVSVNIRM